MGIEKVPNGRRMETTVEDEICSQCHGKGTVGNSPNTIRSCPRCGGRGKVRSPAR